jgi:hypothetical protein
MRRTSLDDIDRAVLLARRASTGARVSDAGTLTRLLYHHWFLGLPLGGVLPGQRRPRVTPWRAWSASWDDAELRGDQLVRLYLACAPHTSLHAVTAVSAYAGEWDVPWLLSSRSVGQPVARPDATVLYLPAASLRELRRPLVRMLDLVRPFLATGVPAATLRVAPGAALAQNPPTGGRFGEHRCGLVAGSVLAHPSVSHREALSRTLEALYAAGVDPVRPYRSLGATWTWDADRAAA